MSRTVLVTGGTGYIGSHTCVELIQAGHRILVLDNLANSSEIALDRIATITGVRPPFVEGDVRDPAVLDDIFSAGQIESVIHFAGLKAVGESVKSPLTYYDNNVLGSIVLAQAMAQHNVKTLVFSSSATVYGDPERVPITEDARLAASNPYGRCKHMVEEILRDLFHSDSSWRIALLRYFNPAGAHHSGLIGEDPAGVPNNLLPYISQVAVGRLDRLSIFGGDYPTRDGTGVRDYIHVVDLARGHLAALEKLRLPTPLMTLNLGTGVGYSVLEMLHAFEKASGKTVPYRIVERRPGDIAECYADATLAKALLGWHAEKGLADMCEDAWRWQEQNRFGFRFSATG